MKMLFAELTNHIFGWEWAMVWFGGSYILVRVFGVGGKKMFKVADYHTLEEWKHWYVFGGDKL